MSRRAGLVIALAVGTMAVRLAVSGGHRFYLRDRMGTWLLLSGAVLGLLALYRLIRPGAPDAADGEATAGHDPAAAGEEAAHGGHGHGSPRIGLALLAPVILVYLVAPQPLGSYAAARSGAVQPVVTGVTLPPLPEPVDGAVDLTLYDLIRRAAVDEGASVEGERVRLRGFVVPAPATPEGFLLTRFRIACCAADALAMQVLVLGLAELGQPVPPRDAWVTVEATLSVADPIRPAVEAASITLDPVPGDPYED